MKPVFSWGISFFMATSSCFIKATFFPAASWNSSISSWLSFFPKSAYRGYGWTSSHATSAEATAPSRGGFALGVGGLLVILPGVCAHLPWGVQSSVTSRSALQLLGVQRCSWRRSQTDGMGQEFSGLTQRAELQPSTAPLRRGGRFPPAQLFRTRLLNALHCWCLLGLWFSALFEYPLWLPENGGTFFSSWAVASPALM